VTTSLQAGYRFLRDDPSYRYPNIDDTGYYCTTLAVPSQFAPVASLTLKNTTGTNVSVPKEGVEGLRGFHDAAYEIEQYNLRSKRYPGPTEFRDIASSNLGALTAVTQAAFNAKKLVYSPTPAECVGTCTAYALSFESQSAVQVRTATYAP
jgi:hypothetical protein